MFQKTKFKLVSLGATILAPSYAMAADFSSWATHLTGQIDSAKVFALAIAFMLGLFLFIMGLNGLYKDSKQPGQDHAKKGMISLAIGTCLLIVPTIIAIAGGTFSSGSDGEATSTISSSTGSF